MVTGSLPLRFPHTRPSPFLVSESNMGGWILEGPRPPRRSNPSFHNKAPPSYADLPIALQHSSGRKDCSPTAAPFSVSLLNSHPSEPRPNCPPALTQGLGLQCCERWAHLGCPPRACLALLYRNLSKSWPWRASAPQEREVWLVV